MKTLQRCLCLLLLLTSAAWSQVTAIRAGKLIDTASGGVLANQVILVENGRITAVGAGVAIPPAATVIDLSRATVLPGLIDCHSHLIGSAGDLDPIMVVRKSAAQMAFDSIPNARKTLEAGFTTVRDVGTYRAFVDVALRDAIAHGNVVGPRMFVAGAYVTISGGAGAMTGLAPDIQLPQELRFGTADGVDEVRKRVREIIIQGVDLIKILATGAVLTHGSNPAAREYTQAELEAAVEEARMHGLRVAAHAHATEGIKNAVRAGVASIEHGTFLDDEGIALMKEHGTYLVADIYNDDFILGEGARLGMPKDFVDEHVSFVMKEGKVYKQLP
ncbi:MAG: amidohydrolase family protein [Terriglobales bacterium]